MLNWQLEGLMEISVSLTMPFQAMRARQPDLTEPAPYLLFARTKPSGCRRMGQD